VIELSQNKPLKKYFKFTFLPFYAMHDVTPSAVAMADSTLMAV